MAELRLPKNKDQLAEVLDQMIADSMRARIPASIEWYIVFHYLRGARYFDSVDYSSGDVTAFYEDMLGAVPFRYEDVLARYQAEIGRLSRLDIRPAVTKTGVGLARARDAAISHVTLDTLMRGQPIDNIKLNFFEHLCMYGTVGATNHVILEPSSSDDDAEPREIQTIDVIPPWELFPLPANPTNPHTAKAIVREQWLTYEELKELSDSIDDMTLPPPADSDLDAKIAPAAHISSDGAPVGDMAPPPNFESSHGDANLTPSRGGKERGSTKDRKEIPHVKVSECWVTTPNGRLSRYIVKGGRKILLDRDYQSKDFLLIGKQPPVMPVGTAVYTGGPGWWGRSFAGPLISLNAEVEQMLLRLFRNVQDLDEMGYTFIPETWNIPRDALMEAAPGRKMFQYRPDPVQPQIGLHQAQPATTGQLPGQIADLGIRLIDRSAQQPQELLSGGTPGRVESGKGIDLLFQTSTVPLGGVATSIAGMMETVYRSILWDARSWPNIKVNMDSLMDEMVVGVKLDPETGTMSLKDNVLPDPFDIEVTIKSKDPVNTDQRKEELMLMLQQGLISAMEFRLINRRESLGLPTGNDVEWQNYLRATMNSILIFNDGQTPGTWFKSEYDGPQVHEYVVLRRMASPEFSLASDEVKAKFRDYLDHLRLLRGAFPQDLPFSEDAAEQSMVAQKEAEAAQQSMGGGLNSEAIGMNGAEGMGQADALAAALNQAQPPTTGGV